MTLYERQLLSCVTRTALWQTLACGVVECACVCWEPATSPPFYRQKFGLILVDLKLLENGPLSAALVSTGSRPQPSRGDVRA